MRPLGIGIIVALAASAVALSIGSLVMTIAWRHVRIPIDRLAPGLRAPALAALRLFPAAGAGAAAALVLFAFIRLEPDDAREVLGLTLPALAIAAGALAAASGVRGCRSWRETMRVVRGWQAREERSHRGLPVSTVDSAFPMVAVVGIVRPRLYIARRVIESCEPREIDAMIAHESAHVAALDNLARLLFVCAPLVWAGRAGREIEQAWTRASEEAADDRARHDERSSLALASALAKVARMAAGAPAPLVHASAILSGTGVEHRVRRLLAGNPPRRPAHASLLLVVPLSTVAMLALSPPALRLVHEAAEYCVRYLP